MCWEYRRHSHMGGSGMLECKMGGECGVWEGMEGGVVWSGMKEGSKGRGKEGCALLMSEQMWKGLEGCGWKGSRTVWAKTKEGIVKYAWICIYAPVNVKSGKGREKIRVLG